MFFLWISCGFSGLYLGSKITKLEPGIADYICSAALGPILLLVVAFINSRSQ